MTEQIRGICCCLRRGDYDPLMRVYSTRWMLAGVLLLATQKSDAQSIGRMVAYDVLWGCVASYASESVVRTQVMYRLIGRERPDSIRSAHVLIPTRQGDQYKFDFPVGNAWGKHSLPAGHVANVTACASFLSHRFD